MSELANKSNHNLTSAEMLFKNNLHAPSVHCAYYSCLQKMCDILIEIYGYTADSLYNESSRNKIGSHDFIINKTFQNLVGKSNNNSENQQFKRNLEDFKRKRVDADYKECVIDQTKSSVSIELAKKINGKSAQIFK
jgi:hypothetical protein